LAAGAGRAGARARMGEGYRNVQPGCTLEGCDSGRDADIDRKPARGQFACATGCTTPRNQDPDEPAGGRLRRCPKCWHENLYIRASDT
jgi:hypothetical protein